jgi:two-component system OmpR family response regulator
MRVMLSSRDLEFSARVRSAFARDGGVVRVVDRTEIWSQAAADEDAVIIHVRNAASAARWCRVARRARRVGPLIACCDTLDAAGVAPVLDAGADDVLATSVAPPELLARVRAICRRSHLLNPEQSRCGAIVINSPSRQASVDGTPVPLRRAEFRLLSYLVANADRVVAARELMADVLGGSPGCDTTAIRVHLSQLRRKLGSSGAGPVIETVRGCGYRLAGTHAVQTGNTTHSESSLRSA